MKYTEFPPAHKDVQDNYFKVKGVEYKTIFDSELNIWEIWKWDKTHKEFFYFDTIKDYNFENTEQIYKKMELKELKLECENIKND